MRPLETLLRRKLHRYVNHSARTETKLLANKMCSAISTTPLLAKRCESTLPNEADSDVTFLVGPDGCRVPGHRAVLAAANPVFRCMLEGPLACGHSVSVPDVPWRGFANLLRYLYQEPVQLPTVQTTLATLYAAHKYQCHGLQLLCTQHLADSLDTSCVLEVFSNVRVYCDSFGCITKAAPEGDEWAPSAPPTDGDEQEPLAAGAGAGAAGAGLEAAVAGCEALRRRCLQLCDERADDVLSLEQLEELSRDELLELVSRDSFAPSSEALVFAAVARWARCRCLCSQRPLCADDLRDEAGDALLYAVRYPFMSLQEFVDGPMRSGLVSGEEAVFFLERINRPGAPPAGPPPKRLEPHLGRLCRPRAGPGRARRRSASPAGRRAAAGCLHRKKAPKKDKKHKAKDADADGFSFYFLSCLSCILD